MKGSHLDLEAQPRCLSIPDSAQAAGIAPVDGERIFLAQFAGG